ncbi:MAG: hypothetical protein ABI699_05365 [Caldimonas sp.]
MSSLQRRMSGGAALVLAAVLVVACGGQTSSAPPAAAATGTVGPAGGTVASADGRVGLTIPAGALGASTEIRITEVTGDDVPASIRPAVPDRVYRLEPAGTTFAVPVRVDVTLPPSASGAIAVMLHESAGTTEWAQNAALELSPTSRVVRGEISHFSHVFVKTVEAITVTMTLNRLQAPVGETIEAALLVNKAATPDRFSPQGAGYGVSRVLGLNGFPVHPEFGPEFETAQAAEASGSMSATCLAPGLGFMRYEASFESLNLTFVQAILSGAVVLLGQINVAVIAPANCGPGAPGLVLAIGLFPLPGLTAPDGINYFGKPFANLTGTGPLAAVAGVEGVEVLDLVTRQVVGNFTAAGDGATVGTNLLGVVPVAQAASAGANAAMIGFGSTGAFVQNWTAAAGWGGTFRDAQPTFDAATGGGGLVSDTVVLVRPVFGINLVSYDATTAAYRTDARFAPLTDFPGGGQLVSAQMPDAASGGVLVLSRATSASISTSSKVFFKNIAGAQPAATLLSWGNVDTRRLRCLPVGTRQACVATVFGGEGRAFLFDPASPRDTPRVIVLTAAAGTLGVTLTLLPNGHVLVAMANFSANSLTVAELSADLVTIHSSTDIPAPTGCTGTAHVALVTDSEGLKAVTTCNGTNNYWVVKVS